MHIVQLVLTDQRIISIAQAEAAEAAEAVMQDLQAWIRRGVSICASGESEAIPPERVARINVVEQSVRIGKPSPLGHVRVLLVDDEYNEIASLRRALRHDPWQLSHAFSGEEALRAIERDIFDVIISDITMRGMSGIELLEVVRAQHPRLVRVLLSGVIESQSLLDAAKVADLHLCKPCTAEQIKTKVMDAMAARLERRGA